MYEKSLNEAELILSSQKDAILPVRKIWDEVVKRSSLKDYEVASLSDFSAMLDGDNRFQIIAAQNKNSDGELTADEVDTDDAEMENLGFYSEDRVKLRSSRVTQQPTGEDDEEVGSIRRKAFVSKKEKLKKPQVNYKKATVKKSKKNPSTSLKLKRKTKLTSKTKSKPRKKSSR